MEIINIVLSKKEKYSDSSSKMSIIPEKKYKVTIEYVGIKGKPYCAYFGAIILNADNKEIERKIEWLNDFSNSKNKINIVFKVPSDGKYLVYGYRINSETPLKSPCNYKVLPLEEVKVSETENDVPEKFDVPENFRLPRVKELTAEDEDVLEKKLVWIFASPRSGTSWLAGKLLSGYTKFMDEPYIAAHLGLLGNVVLELQGPLSFLLSNEILRAKDFLAKQPSYFFSDRYEDTWKFYLRKLILNRIHSQFVDLDTVIVIKEPNGSLAADIVSQCLPKSKILIILRDGRDIIDSKIDALQEGGWGTYEGKFSLPKNKKTQFIYFHSKLWVKQIEVLQKTFNQHRKDLRLMIKYEDLLKDTKNTLKKIFELLKISITEWELEEITDKYRFENIPKEIRGEGKVVRSASPRKWKEHFNDEEKKIINKIMGDSLKNIGYEI